METQEKSSFTPSECFELLLRYLDFLARSSEVNRICLELIKSSPQAKKAFSDQDLEDIESFIKQVEDFIKYSVESKEMFEEMQRQAKLEKLEELAAEVRRLSPRVATVHGFIFGKQSCLKRALNDDQGKMKFPQHVTPIGRMAHVLVPIAKIDKEIGHGVTVRRKLYSYLEAEFGGFTEDPLVWGMWSGVREAHVRITVSFEGKEKIPRFLSVLGKTCQEMEEKCLYLEMGEESFLIEPIK